MTRVAGHVTFDADQARDWLQQLHGNSPGFIYLGATTDWDGRTFDSGHVDAAVRYAAQLDRDSPQGIYVRTTTLNGRPRKGRGAEQDSRAIPGFWADLDVASPAHKTNKPLPPDEAAVRKLVDESGLPDPTVWQHSGHGYYAWWLLDQPHGLNGDIEDIKALSQGWQDILGATADRLGWHYGTGVGDLARVLRLPGTVNRKINDDHRPCRTIENTGRRYSLENLRGALLDALATLPPPPPPAPRKPATARMDGGVRPGDDYEQQVDWFDILTPHGWTFSHQSGQVRYWVRPGKQKREGHGATTGRDPARDRLYAFTDGSVFPQNEPITKFEAFAILEHGGDRRAAARELGRQGYGSPLPERANVRDRPLSPVTATLTAATEPDVEAPPEDQEPEPTGRSRVAPIDWTSFLTRDLGDIDWLPGRLMARGQQIALVGKGKAGKSLLALEWAWRSAAGLPFLGDNARPPLTVLYVDRENSDDDIQERLISLGATAETLANLRYLQFPHYRPLDTPDGGGDLLADVEEHGADLVLLDTVSRFVKGKENDSDTWLDLYRYSLSRLKSRRVACVRLDHFGKDSDRGSRGSSAKEQDIDAVWELTEQPGSLLRLRRTHTRSGHGEGDLSLRRLGIREPGKRWQPGATRHVVVAGGPDEPDDDTVDPHVKAIAEKLDRAGVPMDLGRDRLRDACGRLQIQASTGLLVEVVRYRKARNHLSSKTDLNDRSPDLSSRSGQVSKNSQVRPVPDRSEDRSGAGTEDLSCPLPLSREGTGQVSTQDRDRSTAELAACVGCFRPTDQRDTVGDPRCDRCMPLDDETPAPELRNQRDTADASLRTARRPKDQS